MTTTARDYPDPGSSHEDIWRPADLAIPDLVRDVMYMSTVECGGLLIRQYKHYDTRGYICLDASGQAWDLTPTTRPGEYTARTMTLAAATAQLLCEDEAEPDDLPRIRVILPTSRTCQ